MSTSLTVTTHGRQNEIAVLYLDGPFGSLEATRAAELQAVLENLVTSPNVRCVFVDLSAARTYGAELLGILAHSAGAGRRSGKKLAVTGDHHGLLAVVGLDRVIPCFDRL